MLEQDWNQFDSPWGRKANNPIQSVRAWAGSGKHFCSEIKDDDDDDDDDQGYLKYPFWTSQLIQWHKHIWLQFCSFICLFVFVGRVSLYCLTWLWPCFHRIVRPWIHHPFCFTLSVCFFLSLFFFLPFFLIVDGGYSHMLSTYSSSEYIPHSTRSLLTNSKHDLIYLFHEQHLKYYYYKEFVIAENTCFSGRRMKCNLRHRNENIWIVRIAVKKKIS